MADWTAPFKAPKFTDAQFEKQKDAYVAKNGYTVTLPAFDDVIHIKCFTPMTDQETKLWTGKIPAAEIPSVTRSADEIITELAKDKGPVSTTRRPTGAEMDAYRKNAKNLIPPDRFEDIQAEKARKKQRFIASLGSPQPKVVRSAGAVADALDNIQDALSTLACIGMIACVVIGGTTAVALSGPVGWVAGAATILSLINPMTLLKGPKRKPLTGRAAKKDLENYTDKNPFSKKAKAKKVKNMLKWRPGFPNVVEALQVTDTVFGLGISLGGIMGFALDFVTGAFRQAQGATVHFKTHPPIVPKHVQVAQRALKAQSIFHGVPWKSTVSDEVMSLIAANLSLQVVAPYLQDWNPFLEVDNLANVMVEAPRPTDVLTIEIIEESGYTIDQVCNWPQNGKRWISLGELQQTTASQAGANLRHFAEQNRNSAEAFIAGQNANDFALGTIEAIEGPGSVWIEYSPTERIVLIILDNGWCYPDDITDAQVVKFEEWIYVHEYMGTVPSYRDIWRYADVFCGFLWAKSPDELR